MAAKKSKKIQKAAKEEQTCCCDNSFGNLEAGMLLLIGLIWFLQTLGFFTFGGTYFQFIGAILVLVIGLKKLMASQCCC